ncbi:hypothetical protein ACFODQ_05845 [Comamonas sp. JC664]
MRERAAWASNPSVSLAFSAKASNKSGSKLEALGYSDLRLAGGDLSTWARPRPSTPAVQAHHSGWHRIHPEQGLRHSADQGPQWQQPAVHAQRYQPLWRLGAGLYPRCEGKISKISGPGGQVLNYGYDAADN